MVQIGNMSRATILFGLEWKNGSTFHRDELWTNQVNIWRDVFPSDLKAKFMGKRQEDKVEHQFTAGTFPTIHKNGKVVRIAPSRFHKPGEPRKPRTAVPGRFFPQGFLHGIDGIFQGSTAPARCISREDNSLHFDINHSLTEYDLTFSAEIIAIHPESVERGGRCEDWLERCSNNGPGMQTRYRDRATDFFTVEGMRPSDTSPDHLFYKDPRMVQHLDSTARQSIRTEYAKLIAPGSRVLDLMGSWDSHLPNDLKLQALTVLGMNKVELNANKLATDTVVQDLNQNPILPFKNNSFEAIVCTASIEYLTDPLAVFAEMQRVLVPGGVLALAFSNRWFPPKAIQIWTELHEFERLGMVMEMFQRTPGFSDMHTLTRRGQPRPEDDPHQEINESDPVFMACATKSGK